MTLLELQKRVNDLVAENESRGWPERNSLRLAVEVRRNTPSGRSGKSAYYPCEYLSSCAHTLTEHEQFIVLKVSEGNKI